MTRRRLVNGLAGLIAATWIVGPTADAAAQDTRRRPEPIQRERQPTTASSPEAERVEDARGKLDHEMPDSITGDGLEDPRGAAVPDLTPSDRVPGDAYGHPGSSDATDPRKGSNDPTGVIGDSFGQRATRSVVFDECRHGAITVLIA